MAVLEADVPGWEAWRGAAGAAARGLAGAGVAVTRQQYEEHGAERLKGRGVVARYY